MQILFIITMAIIPLFLSETTSAADITSIKIADGFTQPLFAGAPTGDTERVFIVEQNTAQIKIIKNGVVLPTPFIDLGDRVDGGSEMGLLGLAFHPDYANNGLFFVHYTQGPNVDLDSIVSRFQVTADPDIADPTSEFIIGIVPQPSGAHNGGMIAFGPNDGYLYVALGDGGGDFDPLGNAQNGASQLGKILRIDIDQNPPAAPLDNPFIFDPGVINTIWALGLRNPFRFSFDRQNGDMYIGDVGQNAFEEISWVSGLSEGGDNFGYRCMEGNSCTGFSGCTCNDPSLTLPIYDYPHTEGNCSVGGGYVYRGAAIPEIDGTYFFGDFCTGRVWSFKWNGSALSEFGDRSAELVPNMGAISNITSFGEDANGEIYIIDIDGEIFKIVRDINLLPLDPAHAGTTNTLSASNLKPNGDVTIIWGFNEQTGIANEICPGLQVGILNPRILTTISADESGNASLTVNVPEDFDGISVVVQSVDLSSCTASNVNNENFTIPNIDPMLDPLDPGQAGVQNTLSVSDVTPDGDVKFIWGFVQQQDSADDICAGFQAGILNPRDLATVSADGSGNAALDVNVPPEAAGLTIFAQAVDLSACIGSNVNQEDF